MGGGCLESADLEVATFEPADEPHAKHNKDDIKEQPEVCDEGVDAEHDKDDGIVAGEVAQIVVDSTLHFAEIVGLGQSLDIEELGDGLDVGKPGGEGLITQA